MLDTAYLQNDQPLHYMAQRNILIILQLRSLAVRQQHGGIVRLPARNRLWPTSLTDNIDCLANADVDGEGLELLVEGYEETGMDGGNEVVEEIVVLVEDD